MPADHSPLRVIAPSASPEEAAAIAAALETFMRATAPAAGASTEPLDHWRSAAILEGVSREARTTSCTPG